MTETGMGHHVASCPEAGPVGRFWLPVAKTTPRFHTGA